MAPRRRSRLKHDIPFRLAVDIWRMIFDLAGEVDKEWEMGLPPLARLTIRSPPRKLSHELDRKNDPSGRDILMSVD